MRSLLATATVFITGFALSGCSGQSEMESAYDHCVETFTDNVPANLQDEDFGDPTEYLGYDDGVLTVEIPARPDSWKETVASVGANSAILCVLTSLDAPADRGLEAASALGDGSASWADYTAEWVTSDDPFVVGLRVTSS